MITTYDHAPVKLTEFDTPEVIQLRPGEQTMKFSNETVGDVSVVEIRSEGGEEIGFAYTKKGTKSEKPGNGDSFCIQSNGGIKLYVLDEMGGLVERNGTGPEIVRDSLRITLPKHKSLDDDLFHAEQALDSETKRRNIKKVPCVTVAGCQIIQGEKGNIVEVMQIGNTNLYIIPLDGGEAYQTRNMTQAGAFYIDQHWLTYDEMLISPYNYRNLTALGASFLTNPEGEYADNNDGQKNGSVIIEMGNSRDPRKYDKSQSKNFPVIHGEVMIVIASDAIDFFPPEKIAEIARAAKSPKETARMMVDISEKNKDKTTLPVWMESEIQKLRAKVKMDFLQAVNSKEEIMRDAGDISMYPYPKHGNGEVKIEEVKAYSKRLRSYLDSIGIHYDSLQWDDYDQQLEEGAIPKTLIPMRNFNVAIEGKPAGLGDIAFGRAITGENLPLRLNEISDSSCQFKHNFSDGNYCSRYEWEDRFAYLGVIGKSFARQIKPLMQAQGIYGEPDLYFCMMTAYNMLDEMSNEQREGILHSGSDNLGIDIGVYLDRIYKDWVESNIITDDATIVAYKTTL